MLVVGLDLDDTSEHLLDTVRDLTRGSDEAELHVVHVAPPEVLDDRRGEPARSSGIALRTRAQVARSEIERLCEAFVAGTSAHIVMHGPAIRPVEELACLASQVGADAIVVDN